MEAECVGRYYRNGFENTWVDETMRLKLVEVEKGINRRYIRSGFRISRVFEN